MPSASLPILSQSPIKAHIVFVCILLAYIASLLFNINEISVHHKEAFGLFYSDEVLFKVARFAHTNFGGDDFALRAPFLCLHSINVVLFYVICLGYFKKPYDSVLCALTFMLLPGLMFNSILISKSNLVIFIALLCVLWQVRFKKNAYFLPAISIFIDQSFSILFLGLFFYAMKNKNTSYMFFALMCFGVNMNIFELGIGGRPQNHFVETLGNLVFLFSPLLLLYSLYALIDSLRRGSDLMGIISLVAIVFVLILSIRQSVDLQTFLPLGAFCIPVAIKKMLSDIRVRLRFFRRPYITRLVIVLFFTFAQSAILYGNKFLYLFPVKTHFAHPYYYGKEIAEKLRRKGIDSIQADEYRIGMQLRFYGISNDSPRILRAIDVASVDKVALERLITVEYLGRIIIAYEIVDSTQ